MTKRRARWALVGGLAAVVALLGAGCGSSGDGASGTTESTPTGIKVGLITDLGQLNDHGFNQLAYDGLKRAKSELGVQGRVVESASAADYVPNMTSLARKGYDLIISVGYAQSDAIAQAAKSFPDTKFAIVDVDQATLKGKPTNVQGLLFREQEVGYIVGYLAALQAKRAGTTHVSAVAGYKEPPVDRYLAGYRAGATAAVPGTIVKWGYSQDWDDQAKCKELALAQIAAGSQAVFQIAGGCGLGALLAAKQQKVWGIGVDADQSFLGPHILTSALKGVDSAVFLTAKAAQDGTFKGGGNAIFGLDRKGVGLGTISPNANEADIAATKAIEQKIADGEITGIPTTVGK